MKIEKKSKFRRAAAYLLAAVLAAAGPGTSVLAEPGPIEWFTDGPPSESSWAFDALEETGQPDNYSGQGEIRNSEAEVRVTYADDREEECSFTEALEKAGSGKITITLLKNIDLKDDVELPPGSSITINGGGYKIHSSNTVQPPVIFFEPGAEIEATINSGTFEIPIRMAANSTLNVNGGTLSGKLTPGDAKEINIYDGTVELLSSGSDGVTVNIYGGTVNKIEKMTGGTVNIHGGTIGAIEPSTNGTLNIYGGTVPDSLPDGITVNYTVKEITLSKDSMELFIGGSETLTATTSPEIPDGYRKITWQSSNDKVATVDENGKVTAVAPGTAEITASADEKSAKCKVEVKLPPSKIDLTVKNGDTETREFTYGDTITIEGKISADSNAAANTLAQNQAALFLGDTKLVEAVTVESDGSFTFTYDTGEKGIPVGNQTLTVKYGGSDSMTEGSADTSITLNKKTVTA